MCSHCLTFHTGFIWCMIVCTPNVWCKLSWFSANSGPKKKFESPCFSRKPFLDLGSPKILSLQSYRFLRIWVPLCLSDTPIFVVEQAQHRQRAKEPCFPSEQEVFPLHRYAFHDLLLPGPRDAKAIPDVFGHGYGSYKKLLHKFGYSPNSYGYLW